MANDLNTINGVAATAITSTTSATAAGGNLDKQAFLKLLVTQMQYQDPLDPQDNATYVAQLAQFSSLEQMTNVSKGMDSLSSVVSGINESVLVGQLSSMIGHNVQWMDDSKNAYTGTALGVSISGGQPSLVVQQTGKDTLVSVPIGQLTAVGGNASTTAGTTSGTTTGTTASTTTGTTTGTTASTTA